jgi:hypothetical protein
MRTTPPQTHCWKEIKKCPMWELSLNKCVNESSSLILKRVSKHEWSFGSAKEPKGHQGRSSLMLHHLHYKRH